MSEEYDIKASRNAWCALLVSAFRDAESDDPGLAHATRAWLADEGVAIAEELGYPDQVERVLAGLEPIPQAMLL